MSESSPIQTPWADQKRYARYLEFRDKIDTYKVELGCILCGYNAHPAALDFDHRDPSTKTVIMSSMYSYSWERQREELDKCDVMCANCHRIKSFESGQFSPGSRRYVVTVEEELHPSLFDLLEWSEDCG